MQNDLDSSEVGNDSISDQKYSDVRCWNMFGEWRRCISAFHQFHQYYIHGELSPCKEEKERMYNCFRWRNLRKESAKRALIKSLEAEQRSMHSPNPPWRMRTSPPDDWDNL